MNDKELNLEMYEVLKSDDIVKYCSEDQKDQLLNIVETIMAGRSKDGKSLSNMYYVVNSDEEWSDEVKQVIVEHI